MPAQSRQLAAIMFTDIVGYTKLMGEDEEQAFELLKKNRAVQRPIIENFNGRWLKEIGDGVLASFSTVSDAVYCAATIQKTCEDHPDLKLRIGIHEGEVVFEGTDVFGDGVNIASRLEPLAPIGGILVSESVHRNLGNKKSIVSTFLREEQLKNVKEPIKIYSVQVEGVEPLVIAKTSATPQQIPPKSRNPGKMAFAVAGVLLILLLSYFLYSNFSTQQQLADAPPKVIDKSIAVLPFKDDSQGGDNQYFCDGMMDEILNHLQKITELGVKSRSAVEPYRNSDLSFATKAQELEVAFILEGAVRKYGDRFRVTTQLIDVESGNHLWSETYDGVFSDTIFVIQSNIAKKIATSLHAVITPEEEKVIDKYPTTNVAAYELYIRAKHEQRGFFRTREDKHEKAAIALFDQALKLDPNYVLAIAGRGVMFLRSESVDSAFIYADRVIALAPELNRGYGLKGDYYFYTGKLDLALDQFFKAISLPPKDDFWFWFHRAIGMIYTGQNDPVKAIPYLKKDLERTETQSMPGKYLGLAGVYQDIGDYETAEEYVSKSLEMEVGCFAIRRYHFLMQTQGKFKEALQFIDSTCHQGECEEVCSEALFQLSRLLGDFEKAEQYFDQWQNSGWGYEIGYVYHHLGKTEEADKTFTEAIKKLESEVVRENRNFRTNLDLSRIYAFKGNRVQALKYLAEYAKRGFTQGWHDFILIDPFFESLRGDPEFKAIVKQAQEEKAELREQVRQMEESGELTL